MNKIIQRKMFLVTCKFENGEHTYIAHAIRPGMKNIGLTNNELKILKSLGDLHLKTGESTTIMLQKKLGKGQNNVKTYIKK